VGIDLREDVAMSEDEKNVVEETELDPFVVDKGPHWALGLLIFVLFLPVTVTVFALAFVLFIPMVMMYRQSSLGMRDRMSRFMGGMLLLGGRIWLKVDDSQATSSGQAKLYVGPHVSMLEGVMLGRALGHVRIVAAEFSRRVPLFGRVVHATDPIYVKRGGGLRKSGAAELLKESLETTDYRHSVFPEGTFTNAKSIIQFKTGAFAPGKPVTPIIFHYTTYVPFWNRDESGFGMQIYRLVSRVYTPVTLEILPNYTPSEEEIADPKLFAENVRRLLAEKSGRPLSDKRLSDSPNFRRDVRAKKRARGKK